MSYHSKCRNLCVKGTSIYFPKTALQNFCNKTLLSRWSYEE